MNRSALSDEDWDRIENFIGFGRIDAPVVFIGMEEGLKQADELGADLALRAKYSAVMDLREAHNGIAGTERYFDPNRAPRQPTWRVTADLMLRREGMIQPTAADRRSYRALLLGRRNGDTLLTEILPYPHPKAHDWLYADFGRYVTRAAYETQMLPRRIALLTRVLAQAPRELIACYGKGHWDSYRMLFRNAQWRTVGPFLVAGQLETRIVLTTHFSDRGFNTDAQLAAFARVALEHNAAASNIEGNCA